MDQNNKIYKLIIDIDASESTLYSLAFKVDYPNSKSEEELQAFILSVLIDVMHQVKKGTFTYPNPESYDSI